MLGDSVIGKLPGDWDHLDPTFRKWNEMNLLFEIRVDSGFGSHFRNRREGGKHCVNQQDMGA